MEPLYRDSCTLKRMRDGLLGAYVDGFAQQMLEQGYARASVRYALQLVADFGRWLSRCRIRVPRYRRAAGVLSAVSIPKRTFQNR